MTKWNLNQTEMSEALLVDSSYISRILKGERTNISERVLERLITVRDRGPMTGHVSESTSRYGRKAGSELELMAKPRIERTPRGRLKELRTKANLSIEDLARAVGGYEPGVLRALEDGNARITENLANKLASVLDCDVETFLSGSDYPPVLEEGPGMTGTIGRKPNIAVPDGMTARYVPLISWAQAGTMKSFCDEAYQYEAHLAFNVKDSKAIAVQLRGDSMRPHYDEGDVVILYPSHEPRNGDLVIAMLSEDAGGDVMFKIFNSSRGNQIVLTSYNPAYPPLNYNRDDFAWIYPAASVVKNLRK